jgi:hypothetical protein
MAAAAMMFVQGLLAAMAAIPTSTWETPDCDQPRESPFPQASQGSPPAGSEPATPMSRPRARVFVPMDVWVSDQSPFLPSANLSIEIGGIEVVNGSFPAGGQHGLFAFHLMVYSAMVDAYESTTGARGHFEAFLNGTNDVVILFLWDPDGNQVPAFKFTECPCSG